MPIKTSSVASKAKVFANRLLIRRDDAGRIVSVEKAPTLREYGKAWAIITGAWAFTIVALTYRIPHPNALDLIAGLAFGLFAIFMTVRHLVCIVWHPFCHTTIADREGVSFRRFFKSLGKVQWQEIEGFDINAAQLLEFGDQERFPRGPLYLTARLRSGAPSYEDRSAEQMILVKGFSGFMRGAFNLAPHRAVDTPLSPGRPLPPPGAIEREPEVDVAAAKSALEELHRQVDPSR